MHIPQNTAQKFSKELKRIIEQKTGPSSSSEKVLLDAFKYFDLNNNGLTNAKSFIQVMKIRIGVTSKTEEDLAEIFGELADGSPTINYRELISRIFESQMNLSLREPAPTREPSTSVRDKSDLIHNEDLIKKDIDYITYKLRSYKLPAFFNLFKEFQAAKVSDNEISQSAFTMVLKKLNVEISSEEIQRIFFFLANEQPHLKIDTFFSLLVRNYTSVRRKIVQKSFEKLDYMESGKVSLQLVKELFNGKNSFATKEGRLSEEEIAQQFSELLDGFSKFNGNNFIVDSNQFIHLFSFVSVYLKEDKEFSQFIEHCFRYSELPQSQVSTRLNAKSNAAKLDDLTIRTSQIEDIFTSLTDQLNLKGNKAYINFYKSLKCNDYDSDGYVFKKEFEKSLAEVRINFNSKQIDRLFDKLAVLRQKLDYHDLMNQLVPVFDDMKKSNIQVLWESLAGNNVAEVSFDKVVGAFHARNHPDFRNGLRPDYEIKSEFTEALQTFLNLTQGTHLKTGETALIRFFEFFGRNWNSGYLQSVVDFSFKLKGNVSVRTVEINAPYGTIPDQTHSVTKSVVDKQKESQKVIVNERHPSHSHFYQEFSQQSKTGLLGIETQEDGFKKKQVEHTVNYPYYTDNKENGQKLPTSSVAFESKQNEQKPAQTSPPRSTKYQRPVVQGRNGPNTPEKTKVNEPEPRQVYSPEDGSIISKSKPTDSKDLNARILENSSQRQRNTPIDADAVYAKFTQNLKFVGKIPLLLQLEFEMTEKSDDKGFVDFEVFAAVLETHGLLKTFNQAEAQMLYMSSLTNDNKVHVQNFANKIRGQMSQVREKEIISIFDRINFGQPEISAFQLKNAFLPQKFRFHVYKTMSDAKEMIANLVELFERLNLSVKDRDTFNLDDFLYLVDNFSFFISSEVEFVRIMNQSFK